MALPSPIPELLPARMLNEFVYCPRLFYYEQVEGVFVHNADTLQGKAAHRRVDREPQGLPAPLPPPPPVAVIAVPAKRKSAAKAQPNTDLLFGEVTEPPAPAASAAARGSGSGGGASENAGRPEALSANELGEGANDAVPSEAARTDGGEETIHARSVQLYSEVLGVTAKLDLVEVRQGDGSQTVQPVEYKKGRPRDGDDGPELWAADRMQLGLQVLLLRENGFSCPGGVLFYRETRQRVPLPVDEATAQWVRAQVEAARATLRGPLPPPLDSSPKCPRCSLVSICLPDETAYLRHHAPPGAPKVAQLGLAFAEGDGGMADAGDNGPIAANEIAPPDRLAEGPFADLPEIRLVPPTLPDDVRRLIAPNEETRALYLNTPRTWVSKKGDLLVVKEDDAVLGEFRLHDLHHVAVFGPVQLSTAVVQVLCEREIALTWFTFGGWFYGMTRGHSLKNVFTRIEQFRHAGDPELALTVARLFVYGKIRNQRTLLMRNHSDPPKGLLKGLRYLANAALHAPYLGALLGLEGTAAAHYFSYFAGMLKTDDEPDDLDSIRPASERLTFAFDERNRRPPRDPVNAVLSLLYSLLAKDCTIAAYAVGFDPYVGYLHQPRFGKPALALDLMEEFRPLIADSCALQLVNNRILCPDDFVRAGKAVSLKTESRRRVFEAYERRLADVITHPLFGYKVSYRRALELQARLLAKYLTGEIEQYVPFLTR